MIGSLLKSGTSVKSRNTLWAIPQGIFLSASKVLERVEQRRIYARAQRTQRVIRLHQVGNHNGRAARGRTRTHTVESVFKNVTVLRFTADLEIGRASCRERV